MRLDGDVATAGPDLDASRLSLDAIRRIFRRAVDPLRWDETHRRLAAQPLLRSCSRQEIRHLAHVGDECVVPAGTVLVHQGGIGYWLFVVEVGSVELAKDGAAVATLGSGSHLGEVAILGFGPQPVTATATVDTTVYVLGRRHVLDLAYELDGLRAGLFPGLGLDEFRDRVRALRNEGDAAWRRTRQGRPRAAIAAGKEALPAAFQRFPSRAGSRFASTLAFAGDGAVPGAVAVAPPPVRPLDRRIVTALVAVVVAGLVATGLGYHPGTLVVRPDRPVDVSHDVVVEGLPSRAPRGRYVLTAVSITEPNVFGLAAALWSGAETLPNDHPSSPPSRQSGHEVFRASQREAARLVVARAGADPSAVTVRFRERDLVGPSAGLVYALLLADVTGQVDVRDGRVIAATGVLGDDGSVLPVAFVAVKRRVAASAGADVFVVPAGQVGDAGRSRVPVVSAPTVDAAVAAARAR